MVAPSETVPNQAENAPQKRAQRRPKMQRPITTVAGVVASKILPPGACRQPQVTIGIYVEEQGDEEFPTEVLSEPAPEGFPEELLPHLAEYMAKGFNAAITDWARRRSLLDKKPIGRPISLEVLKLAQHAAQLK